MSGRLRLVRRLVNLYTGLALFGVSIALMITAGLGLAAWDVFHEGVAARTNLTIGTVVVAVGIVVLLSWIPLRERPGLGTVSNVLVVGVVADAALAVLPEPDDLTLRAALLIGGIVANGVATGLYIGAGFGPGPRDGLMTGLARRGHSIRAVRTGIELAVMAAGWLLGGTVGVGTVLYAVAIGPLAHVFIPLFTVSADEPGARHAAREHHRVRRSARKGGRVSARQDVGGSYGGCR